MTACSLVIDCSVTAAWLLRSQRTDLTEAILDRASREAILVPPLWHVEMANVLVVAQRRRLATASEVTEFVNRLGDLALVTAEDSGSRSLRDVRILAVEQKLSAYDAVYLDLAMRTGLPLATKDEDLIKAAKRVGAVIARG